MDDNPGVLVRIEFPLSGEGVLLPGDGFLREDVAVLEDDGRVPEYEVYRAVDVAVTVELAVGVRVERVLKGVEPAPVEYGEVRR